MDTVEIGKGRTHHMLQLALAAAAMGKEVVVLATTMLHAQNLKAHAMRIAEAAGVKATSSASRVTLDGGGKVIFLRAQPTMSPTELMGLVGFHPDRTYVDHFTKEVALSHLKGLIEEWDYMNDGTP